MRKTILSEDSQSANDISILLSIYLMILYCEQSNLYLTY